MLRKKKRRDTSVIRVDKKIKPRKNWGNLLKDSGGEGLQNKVKANIITLILIFIYSKKNGDDNNYDKKMNNNNNNMNYVFKRREVMVIKRIQMNGRRRKLVHFLDGCPLFSLHKISDLIC